MMEGERGNLIMSVILVGFIVGWAILVANVGGRIIDDWQRDPNADTQAHLQQIGGAVCGADELAVPFYATACAEAKSACGSGCSVWDEIEAPANIATAAAEQHRFTPNPDGCC